MPNPQISLKDFKSLLSRRSKALSRHHPTTSSSNPNPNPNLLSNGSQPQPPPPTTINHGEGPSSTSTLKEEEEPLAGSKQPLDDGSDSKDDALEKASDGGATSTEKPTEPVDFRLYLISIQRFYPIFFFLFFFNFFVKSLGVRLDWSW